jgi:DNA-binding CsgD family transcriptional regulator
MDWLRGPARDANPHQAALLLHGSVHSLGFVIQERIRVDLPEGYLAGISNSQGQLQCPLLERWMQQRTVQFFDVVEAREKLDARCLRNFEAHGLRNCALFGKVDPCARRVVLLALYNLPAGGVPSANACATLLESLQFVLARARGADPMTPAEREVLKWVRLGITNYEIGMILGRSRFTVKTHIQRMLAKTGLDNRTQLSEFAKQDG